MSAHSLIRNEPTSRTYALDTSFKSYIIGLEGKIFYWITIPNTVGAIDSPLSHSSISSDADRLVSLRAHRVNARGPIRLVPSVEPRPWIYGSTYWCPTCKIVKKCVDDKLPKNKTLVLRRTQGRHVWQNRVDGWNPSYNRTIQNQRSARAIVVW